MPNKLKYQISDIELDFLRFATLFLGYKGKKQGFYNGEKI